MTNIPDAHDWIHLEADGRELAPGFKIEHSLIADFAIVSNSAGGAKAKDYPRQLQILLEGMSLAGMEIVSIEVDSQETAHLPTEERILSIPFPIVMTAIVDHGALRLRISAAQKPIGQKPGFRGGNGNKRIRMEIRSTSVSAGEFVSGIVPAAGKFRKGSTASEKDVISQIHLLTRDEVDRAIDEWHAIGRDEFLSRYAVNSAFRYKIAVGETLLDAKAILVGALRISRPQLGHFPTTVFNGNVVTVAQPLRNLGFDVVDLEIEGREIEDDSHQRQIEDRALVGPVERQQLVKARRGQGVFRANVESRERCCRVTGVSDTRYLRASHIKPWAKSDDAEKIDGNNGLMLAPHIDFLFDQGLISFSNDGVMILSKRVNNELLLAWGIDPTRNVGPFSVEQSKYLEFHREFELKR